MGNIFLTLIDKGHLFRKPFSWLYAFLAILSLLAPAYFIYNAFGLSSAYYSREKSRGKFELVSQQHETIEQNYKSAVQIADLLQSKTEKAFQNYNQAKSNALYYANYIKKHQQEYTTALQQTEQWLAIYNETDTKHKTARQESEKLKFEYDKVSSKYSQANQEFQVAVSEYNSIAPKGAFHAAGHLERAIIALVLFCVLSIFIGVVIFQIFMDRKSKMNLTSKENDEFIAIPVVAHTIQTLGEAIGIYIGIMGTFTIFIAIVFKVCFGYYGLGNLYVVDLEYLSKNLFAGIPYTLLPIIVGFLTIIISRITAEGIKAIVVIANNTKKG